MCTLIAIHRRVPGRPLVIAANRDEYLDRPTEGLAIRDTRVGRLMAPLDVRAGGTWLGLNERGVFAALTNLRSDDLDPNRRSRGEVVLEALSAGTAEEATRLLSRQLGADGARDEAKDASREKYNPFNLFIADRESAWVVVYREAARARRLEPGVHVIGNVDAMGPPNPKVGRIRAEAEAALGVATRRAAEGAAPGAPAGRSEGLLERLAGLCRHHEDASDPLSDTCVHVSGTHGRARYGTRSSLLLELGRDFRAGRLLHADGPPCETEYEDHSFLLHDLGRRSADVGAEAQARTAS